MKIQDGRGTGEMLGITDEGRLMGQVVSTTVAHHTNHHEGEYYTLTIQQTATSPNYCIGYMKNDNTVDMIVESIYLYCAGSALVTIKGNDTGTPATATTLTPANCNLGSANAAQGTFYKGAHLGSGDLAGGTDLLNWYTSGSNMSPLLLFHPGVIVPKNKTVTFYVGQSSASVIIGVGFYYHEPED